MPGIKNVGNKIRYSVEHFDGGLNTKDAPSKILSSESPDCLNVVFDEVGAVKTRNGIFHTGSQIIASMATYGCGPSGSVCYYTIDDACSYKGQIVKWVTEYYNNGLGGYAGNLARMYYGDVEVTAACGVIQYGRKAPIVYQDLLFFSDGIKSWKYFCEPDSTTSVIQNSIYYMGISYVDSFAPAVATTVSGGTQLAANTYYYAVSHENTQAVEGQIGKITAGVTVPASGSVKISLIPVLSAVAGINKKYLYRAESASGPFRRITSLIELPASAVTTSMAPGTTSVFDNTPVGSEGRQAILDAGAPPPWSTVALHKERLFFNDPTIDTNNFSILKWSNFTNPFVVEAESFDAINEGDGEYISAIIPQDDVLTVFKQSKGWGIVLQDPSDQLTWVKKEHPANIGIYSPTAGVRVQNGIVFLGRKENKVTGFHFLSGLQIIESYDGKLRSLTISKKIESTILKKLPKLNTIQNNLILSPYLIDVVWGYSDLRVSLVEYNNRIYCSFFDAEDDPSNQKGANDTYFWFDLNRLTTNQESGIGSWSIWGSCPKLFKLFTHDGNLYGIDNIAGKPGYTYDDFQSSGGFIRQLEKENIFADDNVPINSYFYTKEFGGNSEDPNEAPIESFFKDLRDVYIWFKQLGDYQYNFSVRRDGDIGVGQRYRVGMTGDTVAAWGSAHWGVSKWGDGLIGSTTLRLSIGGLMGRRFQFKFDNQNELDQGFHINRLEMDFNIRRRR